MRKKTAAPNHSTDSFRHTDILSLDQFDQASLKLLFDTAHDFKNKYQAGTLPDLLKGVVTTLLFYEPSSRTFSSFASAIKRLGGQTIDHQNPMQTSSAAKGETLEDTIKVFESYSDLIIMRHPHVGAARRAADAATLVPVINAGDGTGEHPTQALLDLFTLHARFGRLDHLTGVVAGDLLHGRTVHSLLRGLAYYPGNTIYLLSPAQLKLARDDMQRLRKAGLKLIEIVDYHDMPANADFWYWTRVQKERFADLSEYEKLKASFILTPRLVKIKAGKDTVFLHPLPRVGEIDPAVDDDPRAVYFSQQVKNGVFVRMALVSLVLGKI